MAAGVCLPDVLQAALSRVLRPTAAHIMQEVRLNNRRLDEAGGGVNGGGVMEHQYSTYILVTVLLV